MEASDSKYSCQRISIIKEVFSVFYRLEHSGITSFLSYSRFEYESLSVILSKHFWHKCSAKKSISNLYYSESVICTSAIPRFGVPLRKYVKPPVFVYMFLESSDSSSFSNPNPTTYQSNRFFFAYAVLCFSTVTSLFFNRNTTFFCPVGLL